MDYDALRRRLQKEEEEAMERDEDEEEDAEDEVPGGLIGLDLFSLGRVAAFDSPADRDQFVAQLRRVWRRHRTRLAAAAATKSATVGDGDGNGKGREMESSDEDDDNTKEEEGGDEEEGEGDSKQQQQQRTRKGLESRRERRQHAAFLRQLVGQYRRYAARPTPPPSAPAAPLSPTPGQSHHQQQQQQQHEFSLSSILSAIEEEGEGGGNGSSANGSGGRQLRKRKVSGEAWSLPVQSLVGDASSPSSSSKKAKAAASSSSSATSSPALGSSAPLPPGSPPTRSEKRLSRYRSAPSKALLERMEMAQELRMFLLFRSPLPRIPDAATAAFLPSTGPGEGESTDHVLTEYYVVGPTGTVYSIKLTNLPSCNCPDNTKGHHCIHILFVLLKVLKVSPSDPILYQRALLTSELEGIYKSAPLAPAQAYARRKASSSSSSSAADQDLRSQCGICYEALAGKAEELVSCKDSCNYCFHAQCFHRYCSTHLSLNAHSTSPLARAAGSTVACPVCFTSWVVPPASGSPGAPPAVITAVAAVAAVAPVAVSRQPTSPIAAAGAPGPTAASPSTAAATDVANGQQQQPADADASVSGDVKQEPAGEEKTEEGEKKKGEMEMEMEKEKEEKQPEEIGRAHV